MHLHWHTDDGDMRLELRSEVVRTGRWFEVTTTGFIDGLDEM